MSAPSLAAVASLLEQAAAELRAADAATSTAPVGEQPPRDAWTPRETAERLGIPYDTVLGLIRSGQLSAQRAGRYYVVPDAEIHRYLGTKKSA
ncbi:excisionase family DNA-binding protein [Amycolatopsis sp. CA-230715]|uniref:excisionase family DNA-binding protein n=1 Tax=Amycolatopsis sp. CA-230715 TaxID=2745196 RepID=UPI001C01D545|nr:excisionase family DNA-binding protein [Amycolatopsis sp. CA-230715]QWF81161.1 hypothetical protein HUW46_04587 [Amycolatopsis sp. CA-230715]